MPSRNSTLASRPPAAKPTNNSPAAQAQLTRRMFPFVGPLFAATQDMQRPGGDAKAQSAADLLDGLLQIAGASSASRFLPALLTNPVSVGVPLLAGGAVQHQAAKVGAQQGIPPGINDLLSQVLGIGVGGLAHSVFAEPGYVPSAPDYTIPVPQEPIEAPPSFESLAASPIVRGAWQGPQAPINITDLHQLINERGNMLFHTTPRLVPIVKSGAGVLPSHVYGPHNDTPEVPIQLPSVKELLAGKVWPGVSLSRTPTINSKSGDVLVFDSSKLPRSSPIAEEGYRKTWTLQQTSGQPDAVVPNRQFEFEQRTHGTPASLEALRDIIIRPQAYSMGTPISDRIKASQALGLDPTVLDQRAAYYRALLGKQRWLIPLDVQRKAIGLLPLR